MTKACEELEEMQKTRGGHVHVLWSAQRSDDKHYILILDDGRIIHPKSCCDMTSFNITTTPE